MSTNRKYIQIPIYNVGGWYDIFNHGNISNFEYLQNQGAKGARGNQKLMMGPFGHGAAVGRPGLSRLRPPERSAATRRSAGSTTG